MAIINYFENRKRERGNKSNVPSTFRKNVVQANRYIVLALEKCNHAL